MTYLSDAPDEAWRERERVDEVVERLLRNTKLRSNASTPHFARCRAMIRNTILWLILTTLFVLIIMWLQKGG